MPTDSNILTIGSRTVPLLLVRNIRARRYILRLRPDGSARVTIPRGGSASEAARFAERHREWLEKQLQKQSTRNTLPKTWAAGKEILFRGETVRLEIRTGENMAWIEFGGERVPLDDPNRDLRPIVELHLRKLATRELPSRVMDLASQHKFSVRKISVRNQKSRWGSCSTGGNLSLNWRLVQTPLFVRDYIILHELAHRRVMNHSPRFWREVERICPAYATAEKWLRQNSSLLR